MMKNNILFLLLVSALLGSAEVTCEAGPTTKEYQSAGWSDDVPKRIEFLLRELKKSESKHVMVVAHRGDWRNAPENSILALQYAVQLGVDMVEVDLKRTKDNVLIAMHDAKLDRTTTGKGEVKDFLWSELQELNLRSAHGGVTRHRIPTLKEYMLVAKKLGVLVNIDKGMDYASEIGQVLKETGTEEIAVVKSSMNPDTLKRIVPLIFKAHFMPVVGLNGDKPLEKMDLYIKNFRPCVMEISFQTDTSSFFKNPAMLTSRGVKIWNSPCSFRWCAGHDDEVAVDFNDTTNSWDWLLSKGATILLTDRPAELLKYLERKGLRDSSFRKQSK